MPILLDLFCGAGGAAMGYHRAGFEVIGVDNMPQPRYPFRFHQADALTWLAAADLSNVDAIHASPPCQAYTAARTRWGRTYPDLVADVRDALEGTGRPYVIENVPGAPLKNPATLCGSMFGLVASNRVLRRHRLFETNWHLRAPYPPDPCTCKGVPVGGVYGHGHNGPNGRGWQFNAADARKAMGIDWTNRDELAQAIPPAYTAWVGRQLINQPST